MSEEFGGILLFKAASCSGLIANGSSSRDVCRVERLLL